MRSSALFIIVTAHCICGLGGCDAALSWSGARGADAAAAGRQDGATGKVGPAELDAGSSAPWVGVAK